MFKVRRARGGFEDLKTNNSSKLMINPSSLIKCRVKILWEGWRGDGKVCNLFLPLSLFFFVNFFGTTNGTLIWKCWRIK